VVRDKTRGPVCGQPAHGVREQAARQRRSTVTSARACNSEPAVQCSRRAEAGDGKGRRTL
jgi:hypothetical protein